jgi:hypothetical protein
MSVWSIRRSRVLRLAVNGEPARKGRNGSRAAIRLQRQVMDQMTSWRRFPMTGPVALDLSFRSVHRHPPAIYHAAKHALDALGPALEGNSRPRRQHALYRDDRQVKLLYVDLDQGWARDAQVPPAGTGMVYITARRARDVAADLRAALIVSREDDDDDRVGCPFRTPELPDEPDLGWPGVPPAEITDFHRWIDNDARFRYIADLQEAILAGTDAALAAGLARCLDSADSDSADEQITAILAAAEAESRRLLLSNPLTIPLPGLPFAAGETEEFARQIRAQIEGFRSRLPLFQALLAPVTLTFLVIPPAQGKDLDNIALTALPIAHEVLRPHIAPHLLAPRYPGRTLRPEDQQRADRLRSVNPRSVLAFQAIELPRTSADPPEGSLRAALGLHQHHSWWERASDYLERRIEEADEHHELGGDLWSEVFSSW